MVRILFAFTAVLALAGPSQAQVFLDDFNRANSTTLGPNYTLVGGPSTQVISNQAGNVGESQTLSLVTPGNYSASYLNTRVSADVFHTGGGGLGYAALAFGHNGSTAVGNGLYIKVQNQGTAAFTSAGFYTGVNDTSTTPWMDPPVFFDLTTPFTSARMTVWASDADTINLGLDTDFNGIFDQLYSRTLNLANMTFGTQAGLGVYGPNVRMDNFSITPVPEPSSFLLIGCALAVGGRRVRRRAS